LGFFVGGVCCVLLVVGGVFDDLVMVFGVYWYCE